MALAIGMEIIGALIVLFTLYDVYRDIFHPTGTGALSDYVGKTYSRVFRRTRLRPSIGPMALVTVIFLWVFFIAVGFACVYYPLFPLQLDPQQVTGKVLDRALHSLYMSLGSLGTFQVFDVQVKNSWVRLIISIEGLCGISLITASVSWLVLLYPALQRTRLLAKKAFVVKAAKEAAGVERIQNHDVIVDLADRVGQARIDIVLFPILLNFYPSDRSQTLGLAMPHLQEISQECMCNDCDPRLRLAAHMLNAALKDFAAMLCERVLASKPEEMGATYKEFARLEF